MNSKVKVVIGGDEAVMETDLKDGDMIQVRHIPGGLLALSKVEKGKVPVDPPDQLG